MDGGISKSVNIAQQMLEKALKFQSPKEKNGQNESTSEIKLPQNAINPAHRSLLRLGTPKD